MFKNKIIQKLFLISFGIIIFLILAELIVRLIGYIYLAHQESLNKISLQGKVDYKILA